MNRPDAPAVVGLLALAGILSVGALVLIGMERQVPPEVWALVAGAVGAVGGWIGKTMTTEPTEPQIPFGEPIPVADPAELARRQNNDIG